MEVEFLDTNLILRYLTRDNPDHAERAYRLFQQLERGERAVRMTESTLTEAVHVLSSKALYNVPRPDIGERLRGIIELRGLRVSHKRALLRGLEVYASSNLGFVDALTVAHMERTNSSTILSFDRDFDKVHGITRREP